jgi:uncharacterized protein (DUF924 family)
MKKKIFSSFAIPSLLCVHFLSGQTPIPGPATSAPRVIVPGQTREFPLPPGGAPESLPNTSAIGVPQTPAMAPSPLPAPKIKYEQVLENWFGPFVGPESYSFEKAQTWFSQSLDNQRRMRDLFEVDLMNAVKGQYNAWREIPRGRLALIILLDQVPRNIYGDKPQAYASDRMALGLVIEGIQKGDDMKLYPIERAFFYLPLQHSEDPNMQALSISKYQELANQTPPSIRSQIQEFLAYAAIHQNVISKFGRFPYRNIIYGRKSTPEELEYIRNWGSYPN